MRDDVSWGSRLDRERIEAKTRLILIGREKMKEHTIRSFQEVKE